jgi:hypothetical protein
MTSQQTDRTVGIQGPETPAAAKPELISPDIPATATDGEKRVAGDIRPVSAGIRPVHGVIAIARTGVAFARRGAGTLLARVPGTIHATRAGVHDAASALQTLPEPTLRSLAASSVGLGAGLYLAGSPRVVIVAGMVPAMITGAAIALRPVERPVPSGADR